MQPWRLRQMVVFLTSQHPNLDPRVIWELETAASLGEVLSVSITGGFYSPISHLDCSNSNKIEVLQIQQRAAPVLFKIIFFLKRFSRLSFLRIGALVPMGYRLGKVAAKLLARVYRIKAQLLYGRIVTKLGLKFTPPTPAAPERPQHEFSDIRGYLGYLANIHYSFRVWAQSADFNGRKLCIHANDLDTLAPALLLKERFGCKVVYDCHEYWPASSATHPPLLTRVLSAYEKSLIKRADHVVTVNPLLAKFFEQHYGLKEVLSVPNAAPAATRSQKNLTLESRVKFLYQGLFAKGRGLEKLIDIWSRTQDGATLFLRGPSGEFLEHCVGLARANGSLASGKIQFLEPVETKDLIKAASEFHVGIVPYEPTTVNSRYSCPNKLSQYMQSGLAIFANSELEFVRSIVTKFDCGLTFSFSEPEKFLASVAILTKPAVLQQYRNNAIKASETEFNWESVSEPLRNLYLEAR